MREEICLSFIKSPNAPLEWFVVSLFHYTSASSLFQEGMQCEDEHHNSNSECTGNNGNGTIKGHLFNEVDENDNGNNEATDTESNLLQRILIHHKENDSQQSQYCNDCNIHK